LIGLAGLVGATTPNPPPPPPKNAEAGLVDWADADVAISNTAVPIMIAAFIAGPFYPQASFHTVAGVQGRAARC